MIGLLLVVQVPYTSYERGMTLTSGPIDCFSLRFESAEDVVRMVFDHIIIDMGSFGAALGTGFNVNVRHAFLS
jgi:hypothetical protein